MSYTAVRSAILAHAAAAAAAIDAEWLDVSVGVPVPRGNRCVRLFWGGEAEPAILPPRVLNGRLVAHTLTLVAFWSLPTLDEEPAAVLDAEMAAFADGLRTRVLGDSQLGGQSTDLEMGMAQPDFVVIGGARWATLEVGFTTDFTEYPLAP